MTPGASIRILQHPSELHTPQCHGGLRFKIKHISLEKDFLSAMGTCVGSVRKTLCWGKWNRTVLIQPTKRLKLVGVEESRFFAVKEIMKASF